MVKIKPTLNQVMDGPPGVKNENNNRVHADLILFESGEPKIIVEVETTKWTEKIKNIISYLDDENYTGAKGLLILTTVKSRLNNGELVYTGEEATKGLKELTKMITESQKDISVVEILRYDDKEYLKDENKRPKFQKLRHEGTTNNYWQVKEIRFWSREIGNSYRILFSNK